MLLYNVIIHIETLNEKLDDKVAPNLAKCFVSKKTLFLTVNYLIKKTKSVTIENKNRYYF